MVKPYTTKDKWIVSIISGLLFILLASPYAFQLTDSIATHVGIDTATCRGVPTVQGLIIHAVVYVLIVRAMMR